MALGALEYLARTRDSSPAVPGQLAIAVFDDMPWFSLLNPSLTAIEQPTAELGSQAVQMLLSRMSNEPVEDMALRCTLRLRDSTLPKAQKRDTPATSTA